MFLPDITGKKRNWKKTAIIWTIIGLVLVAIFTAKPLYEILKEKRAKHFAAQAELLMSKNQWPEALQKIQLALQMNPQDEKAIHAAARILTHLRKEEAFQFWNLVLGKKNATPQDFQDAIDFALAARRLDLAEVYLNQASKGSSANAALFRSAAIFCEMKGDTTRAISFARTFLKTQPDDITIKFVLARQLLATGTIINVGEAKDILWEIARGEGTESPEAIKGLARLPNLSRKEIQECLKQIERFSQAGGNFTFLKSDLQLRLEPGKKEQIIQSTLREAPQEDSKSLLETTRWLSQKKEFKKVLDLIPLSMSATNKAFFLVYADAVAGQGNWLQLERILSQDNLPIEPVLVELYRARVAKELKKERVSELHWNQAHWAASQKPESLWYLASYAEKMGETVQAIKAYEQLKRHPASIRPAYVALLRIAEQKGDTVELRRLMKELAALYPNDPVPQNDLAYLELLLRENITAAQDVAQKLVEKYPDMLAYRTTLALAYLRSNNPFAAKKLYDGLKVDWKQALPGWQSVYVAVLGANKETKAAQELARTISKKRIKPEERALIELWLE